MNVTQVKDMVRQSHISTSAGNGTISLLRLLLMSVCTLLAMVVLAGCANSDPNAPEITVYKTASCSCCSNWIQHVKENGFKVKTVNMTNVAPIRHRLGVPDSLASCHTAVVENYVIEGHVPADLIKRMLSEHPGITGLTVPGMVVGSPGMEGRHSESYDVVSFGPEGQAVYASR